MRIIKHGNIPEYIFKCETCGCEFAAYRKECDYCKTVGMFDCKTYYECLTTNCPDCDAQVELYV